MVHGEQNVGGHNITPSGLTSPNGYDFTYSTGVLTVNVRPITLTAKPQTKTYGDELILDALDADTYADDPFTIADKGVSGDSTLPNGEAINKVLFDSITNKNTSTVAAADTYLNEIQITSISDSSISASNYNITYAPGDLTIAPRAITLTASGQEKIYGDELILDDTAFSTTDLDGDSVLPNEEVITNVSIQSATGKDASTTADVATYENEIEILSPVAGTPGSGDGFRESNYCLLYTSPSPRDRQKSRMPSSA